MDSAKRRNATGSEHRQHHLSLSGVQEEGDATTTSTSWTPGRRGVINNQSRPLMSDVLSHSGRCFIRNVARFALYFITTGCLPSASNAFVAGCCIQTAEVILN